MGKGKEICKILKGIRKKIAEANGISYQPAECHHESGCTGTCPVCEEELRYIEGQLKANKDSGISTKIAGVAAGICAAVMPMMAAAQNTDPQGMPDGRVITTEKDAVSAGVRSDDRTDSVLICGKVIDKANKEPLPGASILIEGTGRGTVTDMEGLFSLRMSPDASLTVSFVGYKKKTILAGKLLHSPGNIIALEEDESLLGIVVVGEPVFDDVYNRQDHRPKSHEEKNRP